MKNKNKANAQRAKRKHAKNVARKGKGAEYGKTVNAFKQIAQLQRSHAVAGIDSKHTATEHDTTSFSDSVTGEITVSQTK